MSFSRSKKSGQVTLKTLSEGLLRSAGQTGATGNLLEIRHASAPLFDPVFLHAASEFDGLSIRLGQGATESSGHRTRCDSCQLPFRDKVFQKVVLHHIVRDGSELELREAIRVLSRNGVLLILGLNRMGWRYRVQEKEELLPGLSPLKVKNRLQAMQMTMQGFAGAGLCGLSRPAWMHTGLPSLGAPLADIVLLQARRADSPEVTPLQFSKSHRVIVQSAAMRG